jgi:hypothetical protein
MRRTASQLPRIAPCFSSASIAYAEQLGMYLQLGGSIGDNVT